MPMKKPYLTPGSDTWEFFPADGILNNASNEGYPVDTVDPGFVMEPDFTILF